jgi:TRAP transporter TAXI family solute receptor
MSAPRSVILLLAAIGTMLAGPATAQSTGEEGANSLSGQPSLVLPLDTGQEGDLNGFVIAGGPVNAPGFGLAGALCTAYNAQVNPDGPVCLVRATTGSAENLALVTEDRADFAVVQSDRQYFAFSGQADYAGGDAIEDLRAVFSFAVLPIHVLASATSPAEGLGDLAGGRVGLGPLDSSQRLLAQAALFASDVLVSRMARVHEGSLATQIEALCANELDAVIFPSVLPSTLVTDALWECGVRLIPLASEGVDVLVDSNPFFEPYLIPGEAYGLDVPVESIGLALTLVSREVVPQGRVIGLLQAAFADFDFFRSLHPALAMLDPEGALRAGLVAPQHRGLQQYLEVRAQYGGIEALD